MAQPAQNVADVANLMSAISILEAEKSGQTDTSITIEWNQIDGAASYSVRCNDVTVIEEYVETSYTVNNLEPASEYNVVVEAYDANGEVLCTSNELCAHTNLTVSTGMTLTQDLFVSDLYVNNTLDLNGYNMYVNGTVWLSSTLNVNKGKFYINGDLNLSDTSKGPSAGYLTMQNEEDYILVNGDMFVYSYHTYSTLIAGTIELKGDFTQEVYNKSANFYANGTHRLLLSGVGLQTISFGSTDSRLNIVDVENFSKEGIQFSTAATVIELNDNGCVVEFANGEKPGWVLEGDHIYEGDLNLARGTLDLNGHKLTITGDLVHSGGTININCGELNVQGDYLVQALNNGSYINSAGTLNMTNETDTVRVVGDFVMQSNISHDGLLIAGTLEVGGDLIQKSGSSYNFRTSGTHTVVLNGTDNQTIYINDYHMQCSCINNLKIENTSVSGVDIETPVHIIGKLYNTTTPITNSANIYITLTTEFVENEWNYDASFVDSRTLPENITIGGTLYANAYISIAKTLTVGGDVVVNSNIIVNGGIIEVDGNLTLNNNGYLTMENEDDYILVNGDMIILSRDYKSILTAGTIELKGDFTQKVYYTYRGTNNFFASGNHKMLLSGDDLQTISFESTDSQFNIVDVQNRSEYGVLFATAATVIELKDNGCIVEFTNGEQSGWVLEGDQIYDGDLNLARGTLDLNGYKFTVTGNLVQSGGDVIINGGELVIEGDYRLQALNNDSYINSAGTLNMTNDADIVKVAGDFVMQSNKTHNGMLTAGTLLIAGDFSQNDGSDYNFFTSGTHTVVLNGSEKQTITINNIETDCYSRFNNLKIVNSSTDGIEIAKTVSVVGKLYNTETPVINSKNLYITATTEFADNIWNYDASFIEKRTLPANLTINGTIYANSKLTISESLSVGGDAEVNACININGGKIRIDGDIKLSGIGCLTMKNAGDYVLINGDMYVSSKLVNANMTAGTLEIKGDFSQETVTNANNFCCTGTHKIILSGDDMQVVSFDSTKSQFNIVDVQNRSEHGVLFSAAATIIELNDNGCVVSFADGGQYGWTLEGDQIHEGDLNLARGILDLNGYKLTITGDFIQQNGTVSINGGELEVQGNYRIQSLNNGSYADSNGILNMTRETDIVKVVGDFVMQSNISHDGLFVAGTLVIGGDLIQNNGSSYNFCTSGTHTVVLNGSEKQTIIIYDYAKECSRINNLKIENTSIDGVEVSRPVYIIGKLYNTETTIINSKNLYIANTVEFVDNEWNYDVNFVEGNYVPADFHVKGSAYGGVILLGDFTVDGDFFAPSGVDLNGYTLTIGGDMWIDAHLSINKGELYINGDLNFSSYDMDMGYGYITMQNEEDYILVNGDMFVYTRYDKSVLSVGTIELKGDFIQTGYTRSTNFYANGTHRMLLSGDGLQTISFDSTDSQFNIVDVQNRSEYGVLFSTAVTIIQLNDNGCVVMFANGGQYGWTLEGDQIYEGDLNLARGVLDLNGHKLTVIGSLIQSGGAVIINGGELVVDDDYRIQTLNEGSYTNSAGTLNMTNEADTVKVSGDFVMQSNVSHNGLLTAGTLQIGGDFTRNSGSWDNFYTSGTYTVVLNGFKKQTVTINNSSKDYTPINNLKIENASSDGVNISTAVYIIGKLYNTETPIINSKNLYITATTEFVDKEWNYDASFVESRYVPADFHVKGAVYVGQPLTLSGDFKIDGAFYVNKNVNLNGYELTVGGTAWLSSTLNVNKGRLYVNGDLNLSNANKEASSGYLTMQNEEDYILVNGDMLVYSRYNYSILTAGTIELKGDFTQKKYSSSDKFYASGTHRMLLSGDGLQKVSCASTDSRFNVVEITKPLETGYVFSNVTYNELTENYDVSVPPTAPCGLKFVRSTSTSIVMTWKESKGEKGIFCYEIYRDGNLVGTTTDTEYIDNGLASHTKYEYYVVAKDVANNSSANSETITAYTNVDEYAPTTPTGIVVKMRDDGSIYLTWVASSDNVSVDGYNIYRSGKQIGTSVGNTYRDSSAEPGYHEYYVEAFDNEGNTSLFSSSVFIDNMAPTKPVLSIDDVSSVSITFAWTSEDNIEIAAYKVYKNDRLLKTTKETTLTDTSVMAGNRYSYYVVAIDTNGNISETSEKLSVKAEEDGAEPVISSISCEGKTLSDGNNNVSVLCTDDVLLSGFTAQIKASDSEEWITVSEQNLSQASQIVHFSVGEYISVSGEYDLKITITDAVGNDAIAETSFTYVVNELTSPVITTEVDGCAITLNWTSASDETEVNYMVYKVNENGSISYMGTTADTTCTFSDLKPLTEYSYYIKAQDENGNTVFSDTVVVSTENDNVKPEAVAGNDIITLEGYAASFDGSLSSDNYDIKSYTWDFGDGITLDGETASHIYEEAGVYIVILTVTDEYDNINTDEVIVTVYDDSYCIAEIQVLDENNNPVSGATAYCELEGTEQTTYYGDKNGVIPLIAQSGEYAFYFYAKDYLPLKQSVSLDGISINDDRQSVQLEKREIVTAEFAVEELDIEEIEELGIDVTAPENQHVCKVEMTIDNTNSESGEKFDVYVNQNGEFIDIEYNESITVKPKGITAVSSSTTSQGTTKTTTTTSTLRSGFGSGSNSIVINPSGSTSSNTPDFITLSTMVSMSVTEYSWMKDFFEISITFKNNASADFTIDNSIAELVLPNGLSLADTDVIQTIVSEIGTIAGGTSKTVTWVIKGDTHGSYNASVNFEGQLNPFEIPVKATFTNDDPICVEGGEDTLKLVLDINSLGKADFTLTNASEDPVYNIQLNMDSYGEFDGAYMILVKYPSGMIEKITWNVDKTDTVRTVFLPVRESSDVDLFDFRTLGSQDSNEKITGMIFYQFDEVE